MLNLIKPQRLRKGDKVAAVSLSWGGAGDADLRWRYDLGKKRLEEQFGLEVVEMPHTLKGSEYLYKHPEKRAEDFMKAFSDPSIKAIFSCIGGEESIRMLPYIDFNIIRNNPKIFIGYSDSTIAHFMCIKGNLSSFYGPSIGNIPAADMWTSERIEWLEKNKNIAKTMKANQEYEFIQGSGKVQGRLIGGCIEVLEMMKGTSLWPSIDAFKNSVLFFETSEDMPEPTYIEYWLRNYGSQGILQNARAILWGKPYQGKYYEEYKDAIIKVVINELGLTDFPIIYNMTFGHNQPMMCLPYGALAEINCDKQTFSILESGVI